MGEVGSREALLILEALAELLVEAEHLHVN
jgi:hypothetical protein